MKSFASRCLEQVLPSTWLGGMLVAFATGILPQSVSAATLSFAPSASELSCDQLIDIDIVVDGSVSDLRGLSILIDFDASLLELVSVEAGTLFVDAPCDPFLYALTVPTGLTQIDVAGLGCSVSGPGSVARLRLRGRADGVSPLQGLSATLRDSANAMIATDWQTGLVLVSCPVLVEPSSWSGIKARFH